MEIKRRQLNQVLLNGKGRMSDLKMRFNWKGSLVGGGVVLLLLLWCLLFLFWFCLDDRDSPTENLI